jgi:hypothetical protein
VLAETLMGPRPWLFGLVGLVLVAGSAWWVANRLPARSAAAAPPSAELVAALDGINERLDRLSDRIDRLEAEQGRTVGSQPGNAANPRPATSSPNAGVSTPSPEALEARAAEQLRDMEARLVGDPLSPAWSSQNELAIGRLLSADSLKQKQLPIPEASATRCQSHLCRIAMTFPDPEQASRTQEMLLLAIASSLPSAQTYLLPRADGSVEMVIFAGDAESVR